LGSSACVSDFPETSCEIPGPPIPPLAAVPLELVEIPTLDYIPSPTWGYDSPEENRPVPQLELPGIHGKN
jgi:hypothetical protein